MGFPHKSRKIADTIERWLVERHYSPGDRFPSDLELAKRFHVNHATVRVALKRFVTEGWLDRRVGAGTIVRAPGATAATAALAVAVPAVTRPVRRRKPAAAAVTSVGLAIPGTRHGFYTDLLRALEGALLGSGRSLLLGHTHDIARREEQVVSAWLAQGLSRFVLAPTVPDAAFYRTIVAHGARLVLLDRQVPGVDAPSVGTRDQHGVTALVKLLASLGRRRIVHLAGPPAIWTARVRREAFVAALAETGLPGGKSDAAVVQGGFSIEDGYRATRDLLAARKPPDAIFAANDPAAVGALRALDEHGLRVPGDVAVVGYGDDSDLGRPFGLTTVRQFPERLAVEAVRLVLAPDTPTARDSFELVPELIVRTTT